jgi:hypothetical protein
LLLAALASAGTPEAGWEPFLFLTGEWTGEGSGKPGEGSGGSSFHFELGSKVLVRDNWADYPATKDRPAFSHKDLMIIYRESPAGPYRADYFDNEGHVIHYGITVLENGKELQFLSDAAPSIPRYRMTYTRAGQDAVMLKFEIAPPGKSDSFTTYIEAKARRRTTK